jgi:hypothetical protein
VDAELDEPVQDRRVLDAGDPGELLSGGFLRLELAQLRDEPLVLLAEELVLEGLASLAQDLFVGHGCLLRAGVTACYSDWTAARRPPVRSQGIRQHDDAFERLPGLGVHDRHPEAG